MIPQDVISQINRAMHDGERGAMLLVSEAGGIVFRTKVDDNLFFGFDYNPMNYPSVSGGFLDYSDTEMVKSIQSFYSGWKCVKNNFDVPVDFYGFVIGEEA